MARQETSDEKNGEEHERWNPRELVQDRSECPGKMYIICRRERSEGVVLLSQRNAKLFAMNSLYFVPFITVSLHSFSSVDKF